MPHHPVVPGPEAQIVERPCTHGRAIAICPWNADLATLLTIDVASRGAEIQSIALAWIELGALLVEAESLDPTRILIDPGILHARGRNPLKGSPDVEHESAVFGCKRGDGVRTEHAPRQAITDIHLLKAGRDTEAI